MDKAFEKRFEEYLLDNVQYVSREWQQTEDYRKAAQIQEKFRTKLLDLIPEEQHETANALLDDLDASTVFETDFCYLSGAKHGVRLLKLLGAL